MLWLGHAGFAAFFARYLPAPVLLAAFSSLVPDFVDKGLFGLGLAPATRYLGHTLFFAPALALVAWRVFRRREAALAALFGAWSHLLLDAEHFLPLFHPFVDYAWPVSRLAVSFDPLSLAFEAFGLAALAFLHLTGRLRDLPAAPRAPTPARRFRRRPA
jgi:membrane-bound metal-dependent hydrolase YbcI (DUF457 family)